MNEDKDLELQLETAEWAIKITTDLMDEYKKCKTENCKGKIEKQLRSLSQRLEYEKNKLAILLGKASDEESGF